MPINLKIKDSVGIFVLYNPEFGQKHTFTCKRGLCEFCEDKIPIFQLKLKSAENVEEKISAEKVNLLLSLYSLGEQEKYNFMCVTDDGWALISFEAQYDYDLTEKRNFILSNKEDMYIVTLE